MVSRDCVLCPLNITYSDRQIDGLFQRCGIRRHWLMDSAAPLSTDEPGWRRPWHDLDDRQARRDRLPLIIAAMITQLLKMIGMFGSGGRSVNAIEIYRLSKTGRRPAPYTPSTRHAHRHLDVADTAIWAARAKFTQKRKAIEVGEATMARIVGGGTSDATRAYGTGGQRATEVHRVLEGDVRTQRTPSRAVLHTSAPCRCRHAPAGARTWVGRPVSQYHRPLILGGFAPERTRRRVPESDRSVGNSLTNLTRHGRLLTYSTYGMQL